MVPRRGLNLRQSAITVVAILIGCAGPALSASDAAAPVPSPDQAGFARDIQPFLQRYCTDCHNPTKAKAGLDLSREDADLHAAGRVGAWREVLDRVTTADMPQEGSPQPTLDERLMLIAWATAALDRAAAAERAAGGAARLRRLTIGEYRNAPCAT
jgi:uncharacterized membrane protein